MLSIQIKTPQIMNPSLQVEKNSLISRTVIYNGAQFKITSRVPFEH